MKPFSKSALETALAGAMLAAVFAIGTSPAAATVECVVGSSGAIVTCQSCRDPGCHLPVRGGDGKIALEAFSSDRGSNGSWRKEGTFPGAHSGTHHGVPRHGMHR